MFDSDFEKYIDDEILQKHKDLLKKLSLESKVMCICKDKENNEYYIVECCDNWYSHTLTKNECIELSELFREIANNM